MRHSHVPFFVLILCLAFIHVQAQDVVLQNAKSGVPIPDAFIYDLENETSVLSDSSGSFSLTPFEDRDTLIIKHPSYQMLVISKRELSTITTPVLLQESHVKLDEFVTVAFKTPEYQTDLPYRIRSIRPKDIEGAQAQTSADLLQSKGNVLVQKSQQGGGSPIIRGFEANKILLVVDGVRMNNAIYRSGHLQNVITLDNNMMDRVEVLFGPSSVVYGSDALGGVIHFSTRNPEYTETDELNLKVNAFSRYATVNNEKTIHTNVNFGGKKLALLAGITHSDFGDLRMGTLRHKDYPDFGKVNFYASRLEGRDTMLVNSDPDVHRRSSYNQTDFISKLNYKLSKKTEIGLNVQYSTSSDIPRFDRLNEYQDGVLRRAEWYYGPQKRLFTAINLTTENASSPLFDRVHTVFARQQIEESRNTRSFGSDDLTMRLEEVDVYSLNSDFVKQLTTEQTIGYGMEATWNDVRSYAETQNILDGSTAPASTRYADGGSHTHSMSAYLNYRNKISKKSIFNVGLRYTQSWLDASFDDTTFYQLPFDEIRFTRGALTGTAGYVYRPSPSWQINAVASSGFRTPNVDDVGKIFDSEDRVVVPNNDVNPEYVYNGELTILKRLYNDRIRLNGTIYHAWLRDLIVRRDASINGQDSIMYEGELLKTQVNTNANRAVIWGYSLGLFAQVGKWINVEGSYNYTYGRDITSEVALGHIPPEFGKIMISFEGEKLSGSLFSLYNGWKRIENFSPAGVDNEEQATVDGSPAWYTINLNANYQLTNQFKIHFGINNLLDQHYKPFASGISGPGRNFIISARVSI